VAKPPVGEATHGRQAEVDRRRGKLAGLQFEPVSEYDGFAERQPRFRAVPDHEIVDSELIRIAESFLRGPKSSSFWDCQ
jgi:hypothetical protein